ncbi:MAG: stage II sporulation protein M [Clostridia bacterium]|nr:stage II sporulation protein M [Clostridia bacterium]
MFKIIKSRRARINVYYGNQPQKDKYIRQSVLLLLFTTGMVVGSVVIRKGAGEILSDILNIYSDYISAKAGESVLTGFCNSFFIVLILLIITYSLGLCAVGTPVIYLIPLVSGIGTGTVSAFMYSKYLLKGIGYCALISYPGKIICTVVMITACAAAAEMSTKMLKILTKQDEGVDYKDYNLRYLIYVGFAVLSALTDTVLNLLFGNYFIFR